MTDYDAWLLSGNPEDLPDLDEWAEDQRQRDEYLDWVDSMDE